MIYAFDVTNTGCDKLSNVMVTDLLPGLEMDHQVLATYSAFWQGVTVPADGNLGPFASVEQNLASDPYEAKAWDNFSLSDSSIIDRISWTGAYIEPFAGGDAQTPETDFVIEIFADNGGTPGILLHNFDLEAGLAGVDDGNVTSSLAGHTAELGGPVYDYDAMLPFTVLNSGDYWISITADQTFPNETGVYDPTWQWHLATLGGDDDGFYFFDDFFDSPGDNGIGAVDTVPEPANFQASKNLSFELHGAELIDFNGMLHPWQTVMFMGTYIVTAEDAANGEVVNTASVKADNPDGDPVEDSDTAVVPIVPSNPSLDLDKYLWDINGDPHITADIKVGDELLYAFEVTNDGDTEVCNVMLHDSLPGIEMDPDILEKYTLHEQAAVVPGSGDLGAYSSVESSVGSDPDEAKAWDNFSVARYDVVEGITWTGAYDGPFALGAAPETDFLIEFFNDNGGAPGALHTAVTVEGGTAGINDGNVTSTLLSQTTPGGGAVYEYEAMLPFTELYAGEYWISITALQTFPNADVDPTWQWHLGSGSGDGFYTYDDVFDDAGDNGQGDVDGDPRPAVHVDGKDLAFTLHAARRADFDGCIDPGETIVYMGIYFVTADDVAAGEVVNTATVKGDTPGGEVSDMDTAVVPINQASLDLYKYLWDVNGSPQFTSELRAGDELLYAFEVSNDGGTEVCDIELHDSLPGVEMDPDVLEQYIVHAQHAAIPGSGQFGPYTSFDSSLHTDPEEAKAWDNFSVNEHTVLEGLSWTGAYDQPFSLGGSAPMTDFLVEFFNDNAGTPGALHASVTIEGGNAGADDGHVTTTLLGYNSPGGGSVYDYDAMLPFTELDAGDYWISITALQTFPNTDIDPTWQWHLAGSGDGFYSFDDTFDNPGDNDLGHNDQKPTPEQYTADKDLAFELHAARLASFDGCLQPGETIVFMGTYTVTPEDMVTLEIINEATVTGHGPGGELEDSDTFGIWITPPADPVDINKFLWDINGSPNLHHNLQVGDELIYSFDVKNTGDEKLSNVQVTDSLPGFVMDAEVAVPYVAHHQRVAIPRAGALGPYASTDRTLADDPFEAKAWDNFTLPEFTVVDGVDFAGAYDDPFFTDRTAETDFLVEIFSDSAGSPGAEMLSFVADGGLAGVSDANVYTGGMSHTSPLGGRAFLYEAMLPLTGLEAGDYWISITALQTFPNTGIDPTWQWHLGSGPGDGFLAYDETFDSEAKLEPGKDLAFTIKAAELSEFDGMLEPNESVMFMGTYYVTQDDVNAGRIDNIGTVTANLPDGSTVTDSDEYTYGIVQTLPATHFADINLNGEVDFADFLILAENFGQDGGADEGDLNGDGAISFADFLLLANNFGEIAAAQAVDAAFADVDSLV